MKFGLTDLEYRYINDVVIQPLKKFGVSVYCFGSRSRGQHKKFSDLDLMIEGPIDEDVRVKKSEIEETLMLSNFPYKVDLVFLDEFSPAYLDSYLIDKTSW